MCMTCSAACTTPILPTAALESRLLQAMKLVVNKLMAEMVVSLAEAEVMATQLQLDSNQLLDVIGLGVMNTPLYKLKGPMMANGMDFSPAHFPLKHANKDLTFALALAKEHGVATAMGTAAKGVFDRSMEQGLADKDYAAVHTTVRNAPKLAQRDDM